MIQYVKHRGLVICFAFSALALCVCTLVWKSTDSPVKESQVIKKHLRTLLYADRDELLLPTIEAIISLDDNMNGRLRSHSNDSIAMICYWHRILNHLDSLPEESARRVQLETVAQNFGQFFQSRFALPCPENWLATIRNGHLRDNRTVRFACESMAFSSEKQEVTPELIVDNRSSSWTGQLRVPGFGGPRGVPADCVVPSDIRDSMTEIFLRDSINSVSAIADDRNIFLILPIHRHMSMKNWVICLERIAGEEINRVKWRRLSRMPWGPSAFGSGMQVIATQPRVFDNRLFLFTCFGRTISIEVFDEESGDLLELFATLPPKNVNGLYISESAKVLLHQVGGTEVVRRMQFHSAYQIPSVYAEF